MKRTFVKINLTPAAMRGFTLMEMLIVISIIAVLAGVAGPALNSALINAKVNGAMHQGRQIGLALNAYAGDNNGYFPRDRDDSMTSSNEAFRKLREYISDERVFAVASSNWGSEVDNKKDGDQYVAAGENHFSYIAGLSMTSEGYWPLVVDGTDGKGRYNRDESKRGGCWKGKKAVVVRVDGSAGTVTLEGDDDARYIPRIEEPKANALELSYMPSGAKLLDPEGK